MTFLEFAGSTKKVNLILCLKEFETTWKRTMTVKIIRRWVIRIELVFPI